MREPDELSRPGMRFARHRSQTLGIVLALGAALALVLIVRAQLPRGYATIGGSVLQAPGAAANVKGSGSRGAYEVPAPRTPDAGGFHPATGMVYRCEGRGGQVSFQSDPCGPGTRTTKAVHAPPERQRRVTSAAVAPVRTTAASAQYARIPSDPERDRRVRECGIARAQRDQTLANVGLERTYELLQRLDDMVNAACKGT